MSDSDARRLHVVGHGQTPSDEPEERFSYAFVYIDFVDFVLPEGAEIVKESDSIVKAQFVISDDDAGVASNRHHHHQVLRKESEDLTARFNMEAAERDKDRDRDRGDSGVSVAATAAAMVGMDSYDVHVYIKLLRLPHRLPHGRDNFKTKAELALDGRRDTERENSLARSVTVHPRIALCSKGINLSESSLTNDFSSGGDGVRGDSRSSNSPGASRPSSSLNATRPWTRKNSGALSSLPGSTRPSLLSVGTSEFYNTGGSSSPRGSSMSPPKQSQQQLHMGMDMDAMISCLDAAQEEIDSLEQENNKYRSRTVIAQREIDHLKSRIDRFLTQQSSRQEEFLATRDNVTNLKAQVAANQKTIELRAVDTAAALKRKEEQIERLQVCDHFTS